MEVPMIRIVSMFTVSIFIIALGIALIPLHAKHFDKASPLSKTNATEESESHKSPGHADYVKTNDNATSQNN